MSTKDAALARLRANGWLQELNPIGAAWVAADDGTTRDVEDPATGKVIGTIPRSGGAEATRAVDAADAAFPAWSATTAAQRASGLNRMAAIVRENIDELAEMLTLEQGKPLSEARTELELGASYIQWFAEEARRINGEIIPSPWPDRRIEVTREPVGVVAAISPWNFPFSML